ncbi:MAG: phosphate acyltransferase PlsX [Oscillospiraceae bacterium]|nr:phosphate acyltransferase PlsX [Oscillospiraceae bacterium]
MKLVIDAMGGDNAPLEIVKGALQANRELGVSIILVGRQEAIEASLKELGEEKLPDGVEILNATQVVEMEDDPATATRTKTDSSMTVGLRLVKDGQADAMISAGSTGALLTGATLIVKRIKGIRRAVLSVMLPSSGKGFLIIDCGANAECTPEFLVQFAYMGSFYMEKVGGRKNPRVGLLNIGVEETKGTELQKNTYALLKQAGDKGSLNFVGNVEARGAFTDDCDVLVADGFSGNVLLKGSEGLGIMAMGELKAMFKKSIFSKLAALIVKDDLMAFKKKFDASEVGGTMLLGISKPVIKAHGSAKAKDIVGAAKQAVKAVESGICDTIAENIEYMKVSDSQ